MTLLDSRRHSETVLGHLSSVGSPAQVKRAEWSWLRK